MADEQNNAGSWPQPYTFGANPESDDKWLQEHNAQLPTEEEPEDNPVANNNGNQETKPVPATDVEPEPADPNVMGYDQQIAALQEAAARHAPETEEQRKKRERKEKSKKIVAAITDGLGALSNLFFTAQYAPNMYNHEKQSALTPLEAKLEKDKAEREKNADKYLNYALQIGNAQNAKAATLREMEAQAEAQRLAREKAARDAEKHQWQALLQPDKQREQSGRADRAQSQAVTAQYEAAFAPEMQQARLNTENARTAAQRASANASNTSAARSRAEAGAVNQFSAWDENGNEHKFKTEAAAVAYAKQHGTYQEVDIEETSETNSEVNGRSTTSKKKKGGHAAKPSPTGNPSPTA